MTPQESLKSLVKWEKCNSYPVLIKEQNYKKICEVGVRAGDHLAMLAAPDLQLTEAVGVDLWRDDSLEKNDLKYSQAQLDRLHFDVVKRFLPQPNVRILRMASLEAAQLFPDGHFDFVYIDADHSFEGCYGDLHAWWPKVRTGGIFCGDDLNAHTCKAGVRFRVIEALELFCMHNKLQMIPLHRKNWAIVKE